MTNEFQSTATIIRFQITANVPRVVGQHVRQWLGHGGIKRVVKCSNIGLNETHKRLDLHLCETRRSAIRWGHGFKCKQRAMVEEIGPN
ncbi:hypothetical protein HPP92_005163 [Vanilla planifolia]|uniref:Uncharacterized protein n=1 Tax=Vanilla planifolia TaxID=51239 RepID=A0A835VB33_VANPL|nr:hypothetical protein HPP92_005163 [Vanilla planifolia]